MVAERAAADGVQRECVVRCLAALLQCQRVLSSKHRAKGVCLIFCSSLCLYLLVWTLACLLTLFFPCSAIDDSCQGQGQGRQGKRGDEGQDEHQRQGQGQGREREGEEREIRQGRESRQNQSQSQEGGQVRKSRQTREARKDGESGEEGDQSEAVRRRSGSLVPGNRGRCICVRMCEAAAAGGRSARSDRRDRHGQSA